MDFFFERMKATERDSLVSAYPELRKKSGPSAKVIVAADGDLFTNEVSQQSGPMEMGMYRYSQYKFQNKSMLMNSLEYLTDTFNLLEARAKSYQASLLDHKRVENEKSMWQFINIAIPILLVIVGGMIFGFARRKAFA